MAAREANLVSLLYHEHYFLKQIKQKIAGYTGSGGSLGPQEKKKKRAARMWWD